MRTRNASICPLSRTANAFSRASATSVSRNEDDARDLNAPPLASAAAASPANSKAASRITLVNKRALLVFAAPPPAPPPSTAIVGSSVIRKLASTSKKYAHGFTSSLAAPFAAPGTPSSSLAIFDSNASKMPRSCLYSRARRFGGPSRSPS